MIVERYYAIRVGNPKKHSPCFRWDYGNHCPYLFGNRSEAVKAKDKQRDCKVVKVELRELK